MENKLNAAEKRTLASLTNKIKAALKSFVTIGELYYQALPLIDKQWKTRKAWIETELAVSETHFYNIVCCKVEIFYFCNYLILCIL